MTAEVSYGQFMDVVEEFAFPEDELTEQSRISSFEKKNANNLLTIFFHAMEKANFSQLESSPSLSTMSSRSSLLSSVELSQMDILFQSVQQVLLPSSESSSTLQSMEETRNHLNSLSAFVPLPLLHFIHAFDEFMHNPACDEDQ